MALGPALGAPVAVEVSGPVDPLGQHGEGTSVSVSGCEWVCVRVLTRVCYTSGVCPEVAIRAPVECNEGFC